MYRLKAKLENAQGEQESLRQELEKAQSGVSRIHADRDRVGKQLVKPTPIPLTPPHPHTPTPIHKQTQAKSHMLVTTTYPLLPGVLRGGEDQGGNGAHSGHAGQGAAAA